ncbi:MAG: hypothetical protein U0457_12385 [Candidatus Sericytochromatia bacterium]
MLETILNDNDNLNIDFKSAFSYYRFAKAYASKNDIEKAIFMYKKAIFINSDNDYFFKGLISCYNQLNIQDVNEIIDDLSFNFKNSKIFYKLGNNFNTKDSIILYEKAVSIAPNEAVYYSSIGESYIKNIYFDINNKDYYSYNFKSNFFLKKIKN